MNPAPPKIWSDAEYVYRCLADSERTLAFRAAIHASVQPGDIVLDLGTGSGIMALFAAEAGALRVYAVEVGDYLFETASKIFSDSRYASKIIPIHANAAELKLGQVERPSIVISEMITTGLIGEPHAFVLGTLRNAGIIDSDTLLIPEGLNTAATLVAMDWKCYGHVVRFPVFADYFARRFERNWRVVSEKKTFSSIQFNREFDGVVEVHAPIAATAKDFVNGIMLSSETVFQGAPGVRDCTSYCQPVILPVQDISVQPGELLHLNLSYRLSYGFDSLRYSLARENQARGPGGA